MCDRISIHTSKILKLEDMDAYNLEQGMKDFRDEGKRLRAIKRFRSCGLQAKSEELSSGHVILAQTSFSTIVSAIRKKKTRLYYKSNGRNMF